MMSNNPDEDRWDLIPASMLAAYAYCPRQCYMQWIEGEEAVTAEMAEGRLEHREVDEPGGWQIPQDGSTFQATSVFLTGPKVGISCRLDLLEGEGQKVTPVEYKRGVAPDIPEGAYEPERVQLCAQGLVLRENGFCCDQGAVYYLRSSRRVPVVFDDDLVDRTRKLIAELRETIRHSKIPPPLQDSPKCNGCSLAGICLPDEVNLLKAMTSEAVSKPGEGNVFRSVCTEEDWKIPVYVVGQGHTVRKRGDRLEVWSREGKASEAKLNEISQVSLYGGVEITTPATVELMQRGIPVIHFTHGGWFQGICLGMSSKNVELRKRQYSWAMDPERSLWIARSIVSGKIRNSRALLRRNESLSGTDALRDLDDLAAKAEQARSMDELLGLEGAAARTYFSAFGRMFRADGADFSFEQRNRRPPRDPVNAVLSYLYGVLVKEAFVTLQAVGFDPYLGFYHQPRFGRPSLALDLMEEFRPAIAEPVVIALFNNRELTRDDFLVTDLGVSMEPSAKRKVLAAYEHRVGTEVRHPLFGYKLSYRRVMEVQARLLSRVISGEIAEYPPFSRR
jgi:CRISPR-associated protein Cas1